SHLNPAAEVKWQRRKTRSRIIVLAGQVFDGRIELKIPIQTIAAAHIDLLICLGKVAVREQHGRTERGIEEKCTAVSTANKVAAQRQRQLAPRIAEINTGNMW